MTFKELKKYFNKNTYPKEVELDEQTKFILYYRNTNPGAGVNIYLVNKDFPRPERQEDVVCNRSVHLSHASGNVCYSIEAHRQLFSNNTLF